MEDGWEGKAELAYMWGGKGGEGRVGVYVGRERRGRLLFDGSALVRLLYYCWSGPSHLFSGTAKLELACYASAIARYSYSKVCSSAKDNASNRA